MKFKVKETVLKKISLLLAVMFVMCGVFFFACEEKDTRVNATIVLYDNYDNEYEFTKENNRMEVTIPYDGLKRSYDAVLRLPDGSLFIATTDADDIGVSITYYNEEGNADHAYWVREKGRYSIIMQLGKFHSKAIPFHAVLHINVV